MAALMLSGCGEKKLPTWSEITESVTESGDGKKEESQAVAQQTEPTSPANITPAATAPSSPDPAAQTPAAGQTEPATASGAAETPENATVTSEAAVEAVIADMEAKKWHLSSDNEVIGLVTRLGDQTDRMTKLDLSFSGVTDKGVQELAKLTKLADLTMKRVALKPAGWEAVGALTSLERLDVSETNLTDDDMASITKLTGLKELYLDKIRLLTDAGLAHLIKLRDLEVLSFQMNQTLTGAAFGDIRKKKGFSKLRVIIANKTTFGRGGLNELAGMKTLEVLEMGDASVTNVPLTKGLKGCTKLKKLVLGFNTQLSDKGMEGLKEKKELEELVVRNCSLLTDVTLNYLIGAKNLQVLDIEGTRISGKTARELKQKYTKKVMISVDGKQF